MQLTMKELERIVRVSPYHFYEVDGRSVFPCLTENDGISSEIMVILHPSDNVGDKGLEKGGPFLPGLQAWQKAITYTIRACVLTEYTEQQFKAELDKGNAAIQKHLMEQL